MSKLTEEVDLLRSIPMFAGMPANKLKLLAFASDHITVADGDMLFQQGDDADAAYIVINGSADVLVSAEPGAEPSRVAQLGRNSVIGDMAILADIPRTASVRADGHLEILKISRDHMMDMVKDSPTLALAVLKELVERLARTTHDLSEARSELAGLKKAS